MMVAAPLAALDLPLKVLVWADDPRRRSATPRRVGSLPVTGLSDDLTDRLAGMDALTNAVIKA
jgi:uncharacterized protein (DUF302 family)